MRHIIISDFDETITKQDTISVLGKIPYHVKRGTTPSWDHYSNNYYEHWKKYNQINQDLRSLPLLSRGVRAHGISKGSYPQLFKDEIEYQRNNRVIELASTVEMCRHGLFRGVTHANIHDYVHNNLKGDECIVRDGMFRCLSDTTAPSDFYILSVNWSREFIYSCVGHAVIPYHNIYCNNLLSDDQHTYTGEFENEVLCGSDKIVKLREILEKQDSNDVMDIWYVGDSETDLLSILYPGINGILLLDPEENPKKFDKLVNQVLGVDQSIVQGFLHNSKQWVKCLDKDKDNGLYLAKSWKGIHNLLQRNA